TGQGAPSGRPWPPPSSALLPSVPAAVSPPYLILPRPSVASGAGIETAIERAAQDEQPVALSAQEVGLAASGMSHPGGRLPVVVQFHPPAAEERLCEDRGRSMGLAGCGVAGAEG